MHGDWWHTASSHSAQFAPSAQAGVSGVCGQGHRQPTNMQPGTFCYLANYWASLNSILASSHRFQRTPSIEPYCVPEISKHMHPWNSNTKSTGWHGNWTRSFDRPGRSDPAVRSRSPEPQRHGVWEKSWAAWIEPVQHLPVRYPTALIGSNRCGCVLMCMDSTGVAALSLCLGVTLWSWPWPPVF